MFIPAITVRDGKAVRGGVEGSQTADDSTKGLEPWLHQLDVVGRMWIEVLGVAVTSEDSVKALLPSTQAYVRAQVTTAAAAIQWLDAGAVKVVLEPTTPLAELQALPKDRVLIAVSFATADAAKKVIEAFGGYVSGVALIPAASALVDGALIQQLRDQARTIGSITEVMCVLPDSAVPAETVAALDRLHVDTVVGPALFDGTLTIADGLCAPLVSDRADGLFPTVVTDEQGVALGLVYSSKESVAEAIRLRQGVYQSRKKGLWIKGSTSGATQELVRIQTDCDADALRFTVRQHGTGFCHLDRRSCFGDAEGLTALQATLQERLRTAIPGSYTQRLFHDRALLNAKLQEETGELIAAEQPADVAWEAADVLYFTLVKCTAHGVTLSDVERQLDARARRVTRRPGNAKPSNMPTPTNADTNSPAPPAVAPTPAPVATSAPTTSAVSGADSFRMLKFNMSEVSHEQWNALLRRPVIESADIMSRIRPILEAVQTRGDAALLELTERFDKVKLTTPVIDMRDPNRPQPVLRPDVQSAIDKAMDNVRRFHVAQLPREDLRVETMPGVVCSRFVRPVERVGLYIPGGTAVLPSTTYMLGIPAQVAGCKQIIVASPPSANGRICPEVEYIAEKIGATHIVLAGGAQAIFAMAYGTQSVPKVDKICGPGNQYVTAAKMFVQNDSRAMVSIDMPAGPSELMVIADKTANPAYVASDLLSQAEHGPDSQVVLLANDLSDAELAAIEHQVAVQAAVLPRVDIVRLSIPKSFILRTRTLEEALQFANAYAPEHLIINTADPEQCLPMVQSAGSVFLGPYSSESCGDYASGTNHTLPTYGYARMYSGVNTATFLKHITTQTISREGLDRIGDVVTTLAAIEGLEAHRNSVAIRLADIRKP